MESHCGALGETWSLKWDFSLVLGVRRFQAGVPWWRGGGGSKAGLPSHPSWLGWGLRYRLPLCFPCTSFLADSTQSLKGKWVLWKNELKQWHTPPHKVQFSQGIDQGTWANIGRKRERKSRFVEYHHILSSERGLILQIMELRLRNSGSCESQQLNPSFNRFFPTLSNNIHMFKCLYSTENPTLPFVNQ